MKGMIKIINNKKVVKTSFLYLSIKKDKVIERSILKFNDSDPCIINYTVCNKEICLELKDQLVKQLNKNTEYYIDSLPELFLEYVDLEKMNISEYTKIIFY